jgi:recombinational DNA repair ATPase RecF
MINTIEISDIRGIRKQIPIVLNGRSLVIYGENGTGKSSIIDAIELAFRGTISHLENGGQNVSLAKHAHNISATPKDMSVTIEFKDGSKLSNKIRPSEGTLASSLSKGAAGGLNILRRAQLLEAVNVTPRNRYELLRPFLPLAKLNQYEGSLKKVLDELVKLYDSADRKVLEQKTTMLTKLGLKPGVQLTDEFIQRTLAALCGVIMIESPANLDLCDPVLDEVRGRISSLGNHEYLARVLQVRDQVYAILEKDTPTECFEDFLEKHEAVKRIADNTKAKFYEEVLSQGRKWISEESRTTCPLCENPIDPDLIIRRINERLEEQRTYIQAKEVLVEAQKQLQSELGWWRSGTTRLRKLLADVPNPEIDELCTDIDNTVEEFNRSSLQASTTSGPIATPDWPERLSEKAKHLYEKYNRRGDSEALTTIQNLAKVSLALETVKADLPKLRTLEGELRLAEKRKNIVKKLLHKIVEERKTHVQGIYDEIKTDIDECYKKVHPDERLGNIGLGVKETGGGSATLSADFFNKKSEDPRGYYSESHLDTLGLSIFLALYRREARENSGLRIIVLDDVLASVDAPHRRRVTDLILTEFNGHQLIITTHELSWFKQLQEIQKRKGVKDKFKNLEIVQWTKEKGPYIADPKSEADRLREFLDSAMDKSTLAATAGRLLEMILQELRYSLRLAVEATPEDKYTIGHIWPVLRPKIVNNNPKNRRPDGLYAEIPRAIEDLNLYLDTRNLIGAHYNSWAEELSRNEAVQFAKAVLALWDKVWCEDCCFYLTLSLDKSNCSCRCGNLRYPPVSGMTEISSQELRGM